MTVQLPRDEDEQIGKKGEKKKPGDFFLSIKQHGNPGCLQDMDHIYHFSMLPRKRQSILYHYSSLLSKLTLITPLLVLLLCRTNNREHHFLTLLSLMRQIPRSRTEECFENSLQNLLETTDWKANANLRRWFANT